MRVKEKINKSTNIRTRKVSGGGRLEAGNEKGQCDNGGGVAGELTPVCTGHAKPLQGGHRPGWWGHRWHRDWAVMGVQLAEVGLNTVSSW